MNKLYMIGNTHFDLAWLWTWDDAMASIRATFRSALDRMQEDQDFVYSFCTPAAFEWIRQTDPEMFRQIQQRVKTGQWDIGAEGWWVQPDCNSPCGESLIRQGLYAQRYLQEHFGKTATTVFNTDSFGHSVMTPQIMAKSGLKYYVFARPSEGEMALENDLFAWKSPDGSQVLAYRLGSHDQGRSWPVDTFRCVQMERERVLAQSQDRMIVYGVSNHGGAPTKKALADIHRAQGSFSDIEVCFGSTEDFFRQQTAKECPVVTGELMTAYYGPFSDHAQVKKDNRRAENAVMGAEKAAWLGNRLCARQYPREALTQCWKDILFNHFHDILGGACILEVFEDARDLHGRVLQTAKEITQYSLQAVCRQIKTFGDNDTSVWNLCVFNLNGSPYRGELEGEVQWAWEFPWYTGGIELVDEAGKVYPAQIIKERSSIPGFRSRFVFCGEIPAMGYRTFAVRKTNREAYKPALKSDIQSPFVFRVCEDGGDVWCFNTTQGYGKACEAPVLQSRVVTEKGTVRDTVHQTWTFRQSLLDEWITVYHESGETEYRYQINWNEKQKVLKLVPRFWKQTAQLTAGVPCGCVARAADGKEYPVNGWLRWQDGNEGAVLLLDGITAYDTADSLRLTLLRSPVVGDLRTAPLDDTTEYQYMEQGLHCGRIRSIPTPLKNAQAEKRYQQWLSAPTVICEANHPGTLPSVWEGLSIPREGVVLTAVKKPEDREGVVLRMVEYDGQPTAGTVSVPTEESIPVSFSPYEIKTILINDCGEVAETDLLEQTITDKEI